MRVSSEVTPMKTVKNVDGLSKFHDPGIDVATVNSNGMDETKMNSGTKMFTRFKLGLLALGPGLFLIGYNIGTGSIVTLSKAGETYGMALLWLLFLSCTFSFLLMVAYRKVTIVSGRTALNNFKLEFPQFNIGKIVMVSLIIGQLLALISSGIFVELIEEGFRLALPPWEANRTIIGICFITL